MRTLLFVLALVFLAVTPQRTSAVVWSDWHSSAPVLHFGHRACDLWQCSYTYFGTEHCYVEGDTIPTPCCQAICVCNEEGDDCIWEVS